MRIAARITVLAVVITFGGTASVQAAPVEPVGSFPQPVQTVGWTEEHITQRVPGFVRPPRRFIIREATDPEMRERRHLPPGERRGPDNRAPAHPEEIKMPAP